MALSSGDGMKTEGLQYIQNKLISFVDGASKTSATGRKMIQSPGLRDFFHVFGRTVFVFNHDN